MKSAILPLVMAPNIAPIVNMEPNMEYCHMTYNKLVAIHIILILYLKRERKRSPTSATERLRSSVIAD